MAVTGLQQQPAAVCRKVRQPGRTVRRYLHVGGICWRGDARKGATGKRWRVISAATAGGARPDEGREVLEAVGSERDGRERDGAGGEGGRTAGGGDGRRRAGAGGASEPTGFIRRAAKAPGDAGRYRRRERRSGLSAGGGSR
ncbi:hypothetical protein NL676_007027 [Syzygium grande]|nr:hypothetical protein NL676_007027 [Syzygium grande]